MLERWAKDADIHKKITFHTARHTFATLLLTLGVDIYTVSKLLGHSDVKITEIYATLIDSKRDAAIDKVDGLFK
jgi:site-specific recombinase XerD